MSNSAINTQVAQQKIGNVQNQADNSAVYSGGVWSLKNSTALTSVTITDSGNVGIGTSSPVSKLNPMHTFAAGYIAAEYPITITASQPGAYFSQAGIQFRWNDTGNNAAWNLAGITGVVDGWTAPNASGALVFSTKGFGPYSGALTERMRIDASGNLLVGQNSTVNPPTSAADIYAGGLFLNPNRRTAANAASAYWEAATGVFYRSTSSLRYKTDVQDYDKGLSIVLNLRPVSFKPKEGDKKDRIYAGFIAEEIDSLGLNEFVEYDADGLPDSVGYAQITALLTKAIQELSAKVDAQAAEIEALKAK